MRLDPLRIAVFVVWVVLLGLLAGRNLFVRQIDQRELQVLQKAEQERFYGVWFQDRRIGYVEESLKPEGSRIILNQKAHILLKVLDTTQPIDMKVTARLDKRYTLKDFEFQFTSPFYSMTATGYTDKNTVHFTLDTGQAIITDKVVLPDPPILAVNDRSYLLNQLTEPGQKIKVPSFDPLSLTGRESIIKYNGQEKLLIRRRIRNLHHFTETFSGMRVNFWLDDNGRVVKEESPAGFQLISEPEFRARDVVSSGNELLSAVAVPLSGQLPSPGTTEITYRVTLPADMDYDISGGRQVIKGDLLTITLEKIPAISSPTINSCSRPGSLQPSRYVQSDHNDIKDIALNIVGEQQDPAKQVRLLADWVYNSLEKRPIFGLPDALTTLRSRKGDCNEHASLFAALARSLDIPTVIATGVTLMNNAFYYHAWNEICLGNDWYSLDTTTNQLPADIFHIRFGWGDLDQQLKIGGLIGNLKIEVMKQENN